MSNPWKIAVLPLLSMAVAMTYLALAETGTSIRPPILEQARSKPRSEAATANNDFKPSIDDKIFQLVHERSLFSPERRSVLEVATENEEKSVSSLELVGVGMLGDQAVAAIMELDKSGKSKRSSGNVYKIGETVGDSGYKLEKISLTEALLIKNGAQRVLPVKNKKANMDDGRGNAGANAKKQTASSRSATEANKKLAGSRQPRNATAANDLTTDKDLAVVTNASGSYAFARVDSDSTKAENNKPGSSRGFAVASGVASQKTMTDASRTRKAPAAGTSAKVELPFRPEGVARPIDLWFDPIR